MKTKPMTLMLVACVVTTLFAGCATHEQKKQQAQLRWEKATAEAKVSLAAELFQNGRIAEAEKTLAHCIKVAPELPQAHLLMGRIHFAQARFGYAHKSFKRSVELDKKLDAGWYWLAKIAQRNKDTATAFENYNKAMALRPANVNYIIAVAESYVEQGNHEKALSLLEEKCEILNSEPALKVASGDILSRIGRTREAIDLYNQALLIKGDDSAIVESLGYCYILDKQWSRAAEMFDRLATEETDSSQKKTYLELLAMCNMNDNEYGRAVTYYDQLSVDRRNDAELWLKMGQAALGASAPNRALACARRALVLRPAWPDAIALSGCAAYINRDYVSAIEAFRKISSDEKNQGLAWLMMGKSYEQLGFTEKARKAYQNARELEPESKLVTLVSKSEKQVQ